MKQLLPEDPVTRCGYFFLSIYRNPKDDPYFAFCVWDDNATAEGSEESKLVNLDRHIEAGIEQLRLLQSEFPIGSWEYRLGDFYISVWSRAVFLFASNMRTPVKGDPVEPPEPWE